MSSVLTENIVLSRTRSHDLRNVKKLNCWGSELSDISIVRRMPNVEVLSLSLNNISGLQDFEECKYLQELYLRKNQISDINEIYYLQELPNLKKLSLEDNPCNQHNNYRYTIIKALPRLESLDNVGVTPEGWYNNSTMGLVIVAIWLAFEQQQQSSVNALIIDLISRCLSLFFSFVR